MKLDASTIMKSAISDVVIARYEAWLRRAGQTEPDAWLDRIDAATERTSASIDAFLAIGRGRPAASSDVVHELSVDRPHGLASVTGRVPKRRGRGVLAGRGKGVKVETVTVSTVTARPAEQALVPAKHAQETAVERKYDIDAVDSSPGARSLARGKKLAVVAVCVVAAPLVLVWWLRRPIGKRTTS